MRNELKRTSIYQLSAPYSRSQFSNCKFLPNSDQQRSFGKLSFSPRDIKSYTRRDLLQESSQSIIFYLISDPYNLYPTKVLVISGLAICVICCFVALYALIHAEEAVKFIQYESY